MSGNLSALSFSALTALSLSAIFALLAAVHLLGPRFVRDAYRHWKYPDGFHRVAGVWLTMTSAFLFLHDTRIWGVGLAGFLAFIAVVTLLANRQYRYSLPVMLVLVALVPAAMSAGI